MASKGFTRNFRPLEILNETQIEDIHRGSLYILEETGCAFLEDGSLELLKKAGCIVNFDTKIVKFPPALVEECIRKCPSSFRIKARDPKDDIIVGGNTIYFTPQVGMNTVDLDTWEPRTPTRKENYDFVKIMDHLEFLHTLWLYCPYFGWEGVPPVMGIPESTAAMFRASTKIPASGYSTDCEIFTIQMAQALECEMMSFVACSNPLTYYGEACLSAKRFSEAGMPILLSNGTTMGATGPATYAGAVALYNAEMLAGIVLLQLLKPGIRVMGQDFAYPMNMRSGSPAFGSIGIDIHQVAFAQLWRKYGIPTTTGAFSHGSSKRIDFQDGYEKAKGAFLGALSGAHLIPMHGALSQELSAHPVEAILDDDIAAMVGRFLEGIEVNDETLALDLINTVGPIPGMYLDKKHTRDWWNSVEYLPKNADRLTYHEWSEGGKKGCIEYGVERMEKILSTHTPKPLTDSQENDLEKILKEARDFYKKRELISDEEWSELEKDVSSSNYPFE